MAKAYKPVVSKNDIYQGSITTQYAKDQTTGELFLKSGTNTRCIIPEMFKTAILAGGENQAINTTNTVYTVPDGKVFLILGITLQVSSKTVSTFGNAATLKIDGISVLRGYGCETFVAYSISQNLTSIIALTSGKKIEVTTASANLSAEGCVFGYLIDKSEYYPA